VPTPSVAISVSLESRKCSFRTNGTHFSGIISYLTSTLVSRSRSEVHFDDGRDPPLSSQWLSPQCTCFKSTPDLDKSLALLVMRILVRLLRADCRLVDGAATTTSTGKSASVFTAVSPPTFSDESSHWVYFNSEQVHIRKELK
jgi:hypothetical protein